MSHDKIIEQLKTLKGVSPDDTFKDSTKRMVLAAEPKKKSIPTLIPQWAWAAGFAAMLLVAGSAFIMTPTTTVQSFDTTELQNELENLNIEVNQISYTQKTNRTITSALNEISNTQTNHLNKSILEKEHNNIKEIDAKEDLDNIDEMLNKIIL